MQTGTMKRYSILHPLFMSFFSKSLYRDVASNWRGLCLTYLLIVLTLNLIPDMVRLHERVDAFVADEVPKVVNQVPTITISEGAASVKVPVPYVIHAPWSKLPFAVIDTSDGAVAPEDMKATVMVTRTKLTVKGDTSEIHAFDFSRIHHAVIDRDEIYRWLDAFKRYFIFAVYPFALFFAFLFYFVQVLLCASLGMFFAKMFSLDLKARALIRLSAVAFTPPIVLQTVHSLLGIEFPYSSVISFLLATGYLYFAVSSCSGKTVSKIV
ncbi:MAG TPA: DUF1189 family protein [Dissulfurispiraceae bacterium]|nr:DUF1189 family protein [Dissulfurispiraceae bacterium]